MSIANFLLGIWLFTGIVYRGEELPRPNPNLQMQIMFLNDRQFKIQYSYTGESGFCESASDYSYYQEGNLLHSKVVWLNPENSSTCDQDPDMRIGNQAVSEIYFKDDKLHLKLRLGDEDIVLLWEK